MIDRVLHEIGQCAFERYLVATHHDLLVVRLEGHFVTCGQGKGGEVENDASRDANQIHRSELIAFLWKDRLFSKTR